MASLQTLNAHSGLRRLPTSESDDGDWVGYLARFANPFSTYRCRHLSRATRNLFYYLGRQWIELDRAIMLDGTRGYVFRDLRGAGPAGLPRPVTNYIAPAVDNEVARLGRKEFQPTIPTGAKDPKTIKACLTGKDILLYKLKNLHWDEIRNLFDLCLAVAGTSALRSGWETKISDTIPMPAPNALKCPSCGAAFASPNVTDAEFQQHFAGSMLATSPAFPERLQASAVDGERQYSLSNCPYCPEADRQLRPLDLDDRSMMGDDMLGRPLSVMEARGDVALDLVLPWELHVENGGVGIYPHTCRVWGRSRPVPISYLEERFPEHCDKFAPEDPEMLMRLHPILGEWMYVGNYDKGYDASVYEDHMILTELVADPYMEKQDGEYGVTGPNAPAAYKKNKGVVISMVGGIPWGSGHIVERTDLLIPYEVTDKHNKVVDRGECRKVCYSAARFKPRLGEFHGQAQVDDGISPQNRVNVRDAMFVETMNRMGTPNILVSEGMELRGPESIEGWGAGKKMTFTRDPLAPAEKPEVLQGQGLPADAWQERGSMKDDLEWIMGVPEVEQGEVPRGLKTTSGLLLTGENAAQRRVVREQGIVSAYEKTWSHILHMLYAFRTETETYEVDAKGSSMTEVRTFRGADLMRQYNVRISKEAAVDKSLLQSEAAAEALQDQVYDLSDPVARRRYLELRRLPEINEREKLQIDRANSAATEYRDDGTIPVYDETVNDPAIWYKVLGEMWLSDELRERQVDAGWDQAVKMLAGWEVELTRLIAQDAAARQFYQITADRPTPQQLLQVNARFQQETAMQAQIIQRLKTATEAAGAASGQAGAEVAAQGGDPATATPIPPMPQLPTIPPPVFLPFALCYRILIVWSGRLGYTIGQRELTPEEQVTASMGEQPPAALLDSLLQFRAVIDEARLTAIKMGMIPTAPGVAPPGAPVTAGLPSGAPPPTTMDTSLGQLAMPPAVAAAATGATMPGSSGDPSTGMGGAPGGGAEAAPA